jgi:hypothetical protein
MRPWLPVGLIGLMSTPVAAADLALTVEIPAMSVAEYHRPYVAIWVERSDQTVAANLAVWYALKNQNNEGTKWLKDLRQWWRRSGRDLAMPADGVSGATRAPGQHAITFSSASGPLASLAPGSYQLVVEAAREVGGRELVRVPFTWPAQAAASANGKGSTELGAVVVNVRPSR